MDNKESTGWFRLCQQRILWCHCVFCRLQSIIVFQCFTWNFGWSSYCVLISKVNNQMLNCKDDTASLLLLHFQTPQGDLRLSFFKNLKKKILQSNKSDFNHIFMSFAPKSGKEKLLWKQDQDSSAAALSAQRGAKINTLYRCKNFRPLPDSRGCVWKR